MGCVADLALYTLVHGANLAVVDFGRVYLCGLSQVSFDSTMLGKKQYEYYDSCF